MCSKQDLDSLELSHVIMVDGDESQSFETLTFHTVVYDVSKTIESLA